MYRSRFKEWRISKYWKSKENDELPPRLNNLTPLLSEMRRENAGFQKLRKYIYGNHSKKRYPLTKINESHESLQIFSGTQRDFAGDEASSKDATGSYSLSKESFILSMEEEIHNAPTYVKWIYTRGLSGSNTPFAQSASFSSSLLPSIFATQIDKRLQSLDLILRSIRAYTSGANFSSDIAALNSPILSLQAQPMVHIWKEIGYAIYLLKVASPRQAWASFNSACAKARSVQLQSTTHILELLTTLSPTNTRIFPPVRISLLRFFNSLVEIKLTRTHPIAIIAGSLQRDGQCPDVSERALLYMLELFNSRLGPCHTLSFMARIALIKLLRRSHNYKGAIRIARQLLDFARTEFGQCSLEAREVAREVEHILMETEDYSQALELCFAIVGQDKSNTAQVEPRHQDECAMYAMEDISKIYGILGDVESSAVWLKQALIAGRSIWPNGWVGVDHIADKLEALLLRCGKREEPESHRDAPEGMSFLDKMSIWDRKSGNGEQEVDNSDLFVGVEDFEELKESSIHWDESQPRIMIQEIRQKILKKLLTGTISKDLVPSTYKVAFHLPWGLLKLGLKKKDDRCLISLGCGLSECIVLTCSSMDQVQATTVKQYLDQTWPSSGTELLCVLQEALEGTSPNPQAIILPNKTEIGALLDDSTIVIWVAGSAHSIAERGEQLAWLVAALQHSHLEPVYSTPIITAYESNKNKSANQPNNHRWSLGNDYKSLDITSSLSPLQRMKWHNTFFMSSSIIVQGFPTACRPDQCPGVEVSPEILFDLLRLPNLKITDGHILLQGRLATLELVRKTTKVLFWHVLLSAPFCSCRPQVLLGHEEALQSINILELWHYRHILGDCDSTRASFKNDGSPTLSGLDKEVLGDPIDSLEISSMVCELPSDTLGSASGSALITDSLAGSLDSDVLSMSDTSEDMIIQPLDPEGALFPIINTVVHHLLREYRRAVIPEACKKSDSATDNELTNDNSSPGGSNGTSQTSINSLAPNQRSQGSCGKRNRSEQDDEEANGDRSPRRHPKKSRPDDSKRSLKLLACPFWKLDPGKHRGCFRMKLDSISRVKQHLRRKHTPALYCEYCLAISLDKKNHQTHVKSRLCSYRSCEFTGITYQQREELSKKSNPNLSELGQWFAIWDIVFPDQLRPTSGYMDPDLSEDLCQFREYAQLLGPARLSQEIQANVSAATLEMLREDIDSNLERVISHGLNMLFEEWLLRRASFAQSTASSDSSSSRGQGNLWTVQPTRQRTLVSSLADSGVVLGSQVLSGQPQEETYPHQGQMEGQLIQTQRELTTIENPYNFPQSIEQDPLSPVDESVPQATPGFEESVDEAILFDNHSYYVDDFFLRPC